MNFEIEPLINTPVVFMVFNRPRHTREVFAAIRAQKPSRLFIIADGPRPNCSEDVENCQEVRGIVSSVDWHCDVYRNYAEENLGCKHRVVSGLDWVFSIVDRAIILEDDCLPHCDFFNFCDVLLDRYQDETRVYAVTGNNFQDGRRWGGASYYFSKYTHIWGWATWRRAWAKNSAQLSFWPEWKDSYAWRRHVPDIVERKYWEDIFDRMYRDEIDTWDYAWLASIWFHGGLTATPNVNLVSNIGFGPMGTHTVMAEDQDGLPMYPLGILTHPVEIVQNRKADGYVFNHWFGGLQLRPLHRFLQLPRLIAGKIFITLRDLV